MGEATSARYLYDAIKPLKITPETRAHADQVMELARQCYVGDQSVPLMFEWAWPGASRFHSGAAGRLPATSKMTAICSRTAACAPCGVPGGMTRSAASQTSSCEGTRPVTATAAKARRITCCMDSRFIIDITSSMLGWLRALMLGFLSRKTAASDESDKGRNHG